MLWREPAAASSSAQGRKLPLQEDAGLHDASLAPKHVDAAAADDGGVEPAPKSSVDAAIEAGTPAADSGPPRDPLCDGSTNTRLVFAGPSGTIPFPYTSENSWFRQPYDTRFFAIDGTCHYYASNGISQGILTGMLSGAAL